MQDTARPGYTIIKGNVRVIGADRHPIAAAACNKTTCGLRGLEAHRQFSKCCLGHGSMISSVSLRSSHKLRKEKEDGEQGNSGSELHLCVPRRVRNIGVYAGRS